jgi:hypothetical protein
MEQSDEEMSWAAPPWSVATRCLTGQVVKLSPLSGALGEIDDNVHRQGIASYGGEEFTEQVGGSIEVAGGRAADYLDVVAFPVHLSARNGTRGGSGYGVEIGDREPEGGIRGGGEPECRSGSAKVGRPLRMSVPRRRWPGGSDDATVVVDCRPGCRRMGRATWLLTLGLVHGYQVGPRA